MIIILSKACSSSTTVVLCTVKLFHTNYYEQYCIYAVYSIVEVDSLLSYYCLLTTTIFSVLVAVLIRSNFKYPRSSNSKVLVRSAFVNDSGFISVVYGTIRKFQFF